MMDIERSGSSRNAMSESDREVKARAAAALVRRDDVLLLDVREDDEWAAGHALAARHLPLGLLEHPAALRDVPRETMILAICRSGRRSARATQILRDAGRSAWNVSGGMQAWARAGFALEDSHGRPGTVA